MNAQDKVWVYADSSLTRAALVDSLRATGAQPEVYSAWLHAITVRVNPSALALLESRPWVKLTEPCLRFEIASRGAVTTRNPALRQINAGTILQEGLTGKGVRVGVVDAGFFMMNLNRKLRRLRKSGAVKAFRNYASTSTRAHRAGGRHGSKVLVHIGGSSPRHPYGLATGSEYYLAYTDENRRERRVEEDRWVAALEWLDSLGVRLVNTSLGYSIGFDNPRENHSPDSVDGHSSAITRAAERAAERGMILVVSAGNDGSNRFRVVSLPADAPSVVAVGATDATYWEKQYYSSTGSHRMNYVKPDVSVYSQTGTSFSAPVITGLIACMLEKRPNLSVNEVRDILHRASHLHSFPNSYIGYGVPDAKKVLDQLYGREVMSPDSVIRTPASFVELSCEAPVIAFQKYTPTAVYNQEVLRPAQGVLRVERPRNTTHTTLAFKDRPVEIIWE